MVGMLRWHAREVGGDGRTVCGRLPDGPVVEVDRERKTAGALGSFGEVWRWIWLTHGSTQVCQRCRSIGEGRDKRAVG